MLKRIAVSELIVGMYVHKLCGSWLNHPFWKGRFLLKDATDLHQLQGSGVTHVWIDTSKGRDLPSPPSADPAPEPEPQAAPQISRPGDERRTVGISMEKELQRAQRICRNTSAAVADMFREARMGKAVEAAHASELVEEIANSIHRHPHALISLARLKNSDEYTYMHSVAVCALMVALARQLRMDEKQVRQAGIAGLLHDIGKMAVPDEVLNKPGKLSAEELRLARMHPLAGHRLLQETGQFSPEVLDVCLHHHEKIDGSGYPHALQGERISLFARMGAICDVYDAVTSNRCYKAAWDPAEALSRMTQWQGHFDAKILQAFIRSIGIFPVGALVRLASGQLGVVVEQNPGSLLTPRVRVFYSIRLRQAIAQKIIDLAAPGISDSIAGRESPENWPFRNIESLSLDLPVTGTPAN